MITDFENTTTTTVMYIYTYMTFPLHQWLYSTYNNVYTLIIYNLFCL